MEWVISRNFVEVSFVYMCCPYIVLPYRFLECIVLSTGQVNEEGLSESEEETDRSEEEENTNEVEESDSGGEPAAKTDILSCKQLVSLFRSYKRHASEPITVGFTGYPNVGKSSTINKLLAAKKVRVSETPGKTKHFQTLVLEDDVTLCDCPGLVMPSMVNSKAGMVLQVRINLRVKCKV